MNYLLYQPAVLTEPDAVYKNGSLLTDSDERGKVYDEIVSLSLKSGSNQYPWVGKVDDMFFVRGLFDANDEKGRTLAFLFASDSLDFKKELKSVASTIGYKVKDDTYASIDSFRNQPKRSLMTTLVLSCIAIVILTILIISKCN